MYGDMYGEVYGEVFEQHLAKAKRPVHQGFRGLW